MVLASLTVFFCIFVWFLLAVMSSVVNTSAIDCLEMLISSMTRCVACHSHLCCCCYTVRFVVMRSWSDKGTCVSMLTKCDRRMFSDVFCSVLQWSLSLCSIDPMFVVVVVCKFGRGTNVANSQLAIFFSIKSCTRFSIRSYNWCAEHNVNVVTINVCNLATYEILTIITYSIC